MQHNLKMLAKKPVFCEFLLVFDVEATCEKGSSFGFDNEIIEFPIIIIESKTHKIVGEFHRYVKPSKPLSDFCTELTGITQDQVNSASDFITVMTEFEEYLSKFDEYPFRNSIILSDGPWDVRDFITKQSITSNFVRPALFKKWVDVKKIFMAVTRNKKQTISGMLHHFGLSFEGRLHSGLDDTRNIAKVVIKLLDLGVRVNSRMIEKVK